VTFALNISQNCVLGHINKDQETVSFEANEDSRLTNYSSQHLMCTKTIHQSYT